MSWIVFLFIALAFCLFVANYALVEEHNPGLTASLKKYREKYGEGLGSERVRRTLNWLAVVLVALLLVLSSFARMIVGAALIFLVARFLAYRWLPEEWKQLVGMESNCSPQTPPTDASLDDVQPGQANADPEPK
jgi:hypothetical protein